MVRKVTRWHLSTNLDFHLFIADVKCAMKWLRECEWQFFCEGMGRKSSIYASKKKRKNPDSVCLVYFRAFPIFLDLLILVFKWEITNEIHFLHELLHRKSRKKKQEPQKCFFPFYCGTWGHIIKIYSRFERISWSLGPRKGINYLN